MLRIGFFTSLRVNVGDEFIREGLRAVLDALDVPYSPLYVNKVDRNSLFRPEEDESELFEDKFWDSDVFIQAGAPVYWHFYEGRSSSLTSEWHDWFWVQRVLDDSREGPVFANMGAGSCQPWGDRGDSFVADPACAAFARAAGERAALTTVRDSIAAGILTKLQVPHVELACPAFLAACRHAVVTPRERAIGVNLMALGAHYDLGNDFDRDAWRVESLCLCARLRELGTLTFVCHDADERDFAAGLADPGERVFHAATWREYLDVYAGCALVVANRVHGAVCAAGFGVPALIMGNDTRANIGDYIGLPVFRSGAVSAAEVATCAQRLYETRADERRRLLTLRDFAMTKHKQVMLPLLERASQRRVERLRRPPPPPAARLSFASVRDLESEKFRGFMKTINAFAVRHDLHVFENWSKVWEYPWLWFGGLDRVRWDGAHVVDLGSEMSPMPWFLATLGARVTICETDPQWQPRWSALKERLGGDLQWRIVDSEKLPFASDSIDVLISFSVIEHQPDKATAVGEVARVLRPGGMFAVSFDICEPDMGMTFPEWNGRALTMREFEDCVWLHPAFGQKQRPVWNTGEIETFRSWHLRSAPHHNYVCAAAVLRKAP